jgi:hypothetical protein
VWSSPSIGTDGTLYIGSNDGNLYAFFGAAVSAPTAWPVFRQNARHSGLGWWGEPSIVLQPQSQKGVEGSTVELSVLAYGTEPLAYQWRFKGQDITNATGSLLILDQVTQDRAGSYDVVVNNLLGPPLTSSAAEAIVTLARPPVLGGITVSNGKIVIEWEAGTVLEWTDQLDTPWRPLPEARSPFEVESLGEMGFYRVRWLKRGPAIRQ